MTCAASIAFAMLPFHGRCAFHERRPVPGVPGLLNTRLPVLKDMVTLRGGWQPNQHDSHTFFGPSALPLERGQGYYQNSYVMVHSAWFAPLNNVSIGGGFQLLSVINSFRDSGKPPTVFLALKASGRLNALVHVGVFAIGAQLTDNPPFQDSLSTNRKMGAITSQTTIGTPDMHATISLGWGLVGTGFTKEPLIGFSGQIRVIDRLSIVSENWMLRFGKEPFSIYTLGVRFLHRKLGADLAAVYNERLADRFAAVIPYLGFSLRF